MSTQIIENQNLRGEPEKARGKEITSKVSASENGGK